MNSEDTGKRVVSGRRRIKFELAAEPGCQVNVAGTFNNWDPTAHRMKDNPGGGSYQKTVLIPPGRHEYKFIVNGEWCVDPYSEWVPNGHGSLNSVLTV